MKSMKKDWYKKGWTLDIQNMSWVEDTNRQVDFLIKQLQLKGTEKILDLACGFGRHSLEFARRGYDVTGIDITPVYIDYANEQAKKENLNAKFICQEKIFRQTMGGQGYLSRRETIRHRKIPTKPVTIQKLLLRSSSPVINSQPTDRMEARIDRVAVMTRSTFSPLEEKIKNSIKTRASPKRTSVINFSNARYRFFLATNHPSNGHFLEVSYHTLS